jgi:folate-binding Fe-S cluster repair protein YgfZ
MTAWQISLAIEEALWAEAPQPRDWSVEAEQIRRWREADAANGEPWADDIMKEEGR